MTHWVLPAALQPNIATSALKGRACAFFNDAASNTALRAARESLKLDSVRRALSTALYQPSARAGTGAAAIPPFKTPNAQAPDRRGLAGSIETAPSIGGHPMSGPFSLRRRRRKTEAGVPKRRLI